MCKPPTSINTALDVHFQFVYNHQQLGITGAIPANEVQGYYDNVAHALTHARTHARMHARTHACTQPFYGSMDFVWDTWVSQHQKGKTRKVKTMWIY